MTTSTPWSPISISNLPSATKKWGFPQVSLLLAFQTLLASCQGSVGSDLPGLDVGQGPGASARGPHLAPPKPLQPWRNRTSPGFWMPDEKVKNLWLVWPELRASVARGGAGAEATFQMHVCSFSVSRAPSVWAEDTETPHARFSVCFPRLQPGSTSPSCLPSFCPSPLSP